MSELNLEKHKPMEAYPHDQIKNPKPVRDIKFESVDDEILWRAEYEDGTLSGPASTGLSMESGKEGIAHFKEKKLNELQQRPELEQAA